MQPTERRLRQVSTDEEWAAYHAIREQVLWNARGHGGKYDPSHPDDRKSSNFPLLFFRDDTAIGVLRVDVEGSTAWFRRVAISKKYQRQGHGKVMMMMAMDFAREKGCSVGRSMVDPGAVGFYRALGFGEVDESHREGGVPMMRQL